MRTNLKDHIKQPTISNLFRIDFQCLIEYEGGKNLSELSKEAGVTVEEIRYLKRKSYRS